MAEPRMFKTFYGWAAVTGIGFVTLYFVRKSIAQRRREELLRELGEERRRITTIR
ncbi:uncharacterized protein EV422DRAFT_568632 [Fimicolochytrium jonesii]|uniref:uncharacterized protein n=1 Tax=Fimicolochytrium jonesii TaxID=1396493 RepID=UPI0022FF2AA3|nr:uncharacterized protein EV422DRAFT_568632 [Fimicolochytrium jonesii]KAI8819671.1 hypothetical protein EV422DRAFT_568632 [Fimicolochytrium jonesii]